MSDLVERLRERADYEGYPGAMLIIEAADDIERLQARLAEYEEAYRITVDDCGSPDEKHCSCVPSLRQKIAELTQQEAARFELSCEWRNAAERLQARCAELEKDAARYRWLRDEAYRLAVGYVRVPPDWLADERTTATDDAAIDAAMER